MLWKLENVRILFFDSLYQLGHFMVKESEILKSIKNNLPLFVQEVVWCDRMQSGAIQQGNYVIRLCKIGTPDLYAIINYDGGRVLFIECKKPKCKQSDAQKEFEYKIKGMKNVQYMVAHSLMEVVDYIKDNIINDKAVS